MSLPDSDTQAIIQQTDLWLQGAVDGGYQRLNDILADDFLYSSHAKYGVSTMTKPEMIKLASMLKDAGTEKLEQTITKVGDIAISLTVTKSLEKITGEVGDFASSDAMNASMNGKVLVYASGWRKDGATWKCFDMHLVDALPA